MAPPTLASLVALSTTCPDAHLRALVQANDKVFLNPALIGNMMWPLPRQLQHYLSESAKHSPSLLADIEHALRTGVVRGEAVGDDESDGDDYDEELAIEWRQSSSVAWAAALRSQARHSHGCVVTEDGQCFGPVPIVDWLEDHLPKALDAFQRTTKATGDTAEEEQQQASRAVKALAGSIDAELRGQHPRLSLLRQLASRLALLVHHMGACRAPGDTLPDATERHRATGCVLAVAEWLAARWRAAPEEHASLVGDISCLGFVGSLVVEQDAEAWAEASREEAKLAAELGLKGHHATDDDACLGWSGDADGPERHADALVFLAQIVCAEAATRGGDEV